MSESESKSEIELDCCIVKRDLVEQAYYIWIYHVALRRRCCRLHLIDVLVRMFARSLRVQNVNYGCVCVCMAHLGAKWLGLRNLRISLLWIDMRPLMYGV